MLQQARATCRALSVLQSVLSSVVSERTLALASFGFNHLPDRSLMQTAVPVLAAPSRRASGRAGLLAVGSTERAQAHHFEFPAPPSVPSQPHLRLHARSTASCAGACKVAPTRSHVWSAAPVLGAVAFVTITR